MWATRPREAIHFKEDRVYEWMSKGAQPSEAVVKLFKVTGLLDRYERFKQGEDIEVLLEEAAQVEADRDVDLKTRRDSQPKKDKATESA